MERPLLFPEHYHSALGLIETQRAIKFAKDLFEDKLAGKLNLTRVSAPMFVRPETGLNDDLNGVERAVAFDVPDAGFDVQVVHSLAKWKRSALRAYGFAPGEGLYTDMNAIRRDETLDNLHSVYVDQWDWERIITREQRTIEYLKGTVELIMSALWETERMLCRAFPSLTPFLTREPVFITAEELLAKYPALTPKQREDAAAREYGSVFVIGIGGKLSDGKPHDGRAPDYDDWALNGDLLVWYPLLERAVELSSMGIRVDAQSLRHQLALAGSEDRAALPFHRALLADELPLTIGGGIGQSRICMVMLQKAHIGEVQSSVWPEDAVAACEAHGVHLL